MKKIFTQNNNKTLYAENVDHTAEIIGFRNNCKNIYVFKDGNAWIVTDAIGSYALGGSGVRSSGNLSSLMDKFPNHNFYQITEFSSKRILCKKDLLFANDVKYGSLVVGFNEENLAVYVVHTGTSWSAINNRNILLNKVGYSMLNDLIESFPDYTFYQIEKPS